jgi:translation elongation factor EF-4
MAELRSRAFGLWSAVFLGIGSMVGAGVCPIETDKFEDLRDLLNKIN